MTVAELAGALVALTKEDKALLRERLPPPNAESVIGQIDRLIPADHAKVVSYVLRTSQVAKALSGLTGRRAV